MKHLLRLLLRALWRCTRGLRRPMLVEIEEHLAGRFERISARLEAMQDDAERAAMQQSLFSQSLVREMARLQIQVAELQPLDGDRRGEAPDRHAAQVQRAA